MLSKGVILRWQKGIEHYNNRDYQSGVKLFKDLGDNAKFHYNAGILLMLSGNFAGAIPCFSRAVDMDKFFSIAFFSRAVCKAYTKDHMKAILDCTKSLELLRERDYVDYSQLGLGFALLRTELLFNRALSLASMGMWDKARPDLKLAAKCTTDETRHAPIPKLMKDVENRNTGALASYKMFTVSAPHLFSPPNVENLGGGPLVQAAQKDEVMKNLEAPVPQQAPRGAEQFLPAWEVEDRTAGVAYNTTVAGVVGKEKKLGVLKEMERDAKRAEREERKGRSRDRERDRSPPRSRSRGRSRKDKSGGRGHGKSKGRDRDRGGGGSGGGREDNYASSKSKGGGGIAGEFKSKFQDLDRKYAKAGGRDRDQIEDDMDRLFNKVNKAYKGAKRDYEDARADGDPGYIADAREVMVRLEKLMDKIEDSDAMQAGREDPSGGGMGFFNDF